MPKALRNTALKMDNSFSKEIRLENQGIIDKIDSVSNNCSKNYFRNILISLAKENATNTLTICDYLISEEIELNIKPSTKEVKLKTLVWLSNYFEDKLAFRDMSKEDILGYLKKDKRGPDNDKSQRWIGTYNGRQMILLKFFKWLYYSTEPNNRLRKTPLCMSGIRQLRRQGSIRIRRPSNIWS